MYGFDKKLKYAGGMIQQKWNSKVKEEKYWHVYEIPVSFPYQPSALLFFSQRTVSTPPPPL